VIVFNVYVFFTVISKNWFYSRIRNSCTDTARKSVKLENYGGDDDGGVVVVKRNISLIDLTDEEGENSELNTTTFPVAIPETDNFKDAAVALKVILHC